MDKMRKIHCLEQSKKGFDDLPTKEISDMAGFLLPEVMNKGTAYEQTVWEVQTLFEGQIFVTIDEHTAWIIANQEMIKGMLIKLLEEKK